jgi:endonuclease YncB( thermonuclease family)
VSKHWKPRRPTVELRPSGIGRQPARPSRIRRDPVRLEKAVEPQPDSPEREMWGGIAGVVLFALIGAALIVGIAVITSHRNTAAAAEAVPQFGHCYNHSGPNCVVDGDTIRVAGESIEIAGMDAPEIRAAQCPEEADRGVDAAVRLVALLNSGKVTIAAPERQADGQLLRKVEVGRRDVGRAMVRAGVARVYAGEGVSERRGWCSSK